MTAAQVILFYKDLKAKYPKDYGFENPKTLDEIGYALLEKNRINEAIAIFSYNTKLFPKDGNAFDSLGEAYYKQGDKKNALINYKKSLKLEPDNKGAKDMVAALSK